MIPQTGYNGEKGVGKTKPGTFGALEKLGDLGMSNACHSIVIFRCYTVNPLHTPTCRVIHLADSGDLEADTSGVRSWELLGYGDGQ